MMMPHVQKEVSTAGDAMMLPPTHQGPANLFNSKEAIFWAERCMVRYSYNLIYGIEKQYVPVLDYLLHNCPPDIDEQNCNNCHKESVSEIQTCCGGKQGGRVLKPSCNLRYEAWRNWREDTVENIIDPVLTRSS
ncbi:unnamed protein product [Prunus brigantina]